MDVCSLEWLSCGFRPYLKHIFSHAICDRSAESKDPVLDFVTWPQFSHTVIQCRKTNSVRRVSFGTGIRITTPTRHQRHVRKNERHNNVNINHIVINNYSFLALFILRSQQNSKQHSNKHADQDSASEQH